MTKNLELLYCVRTGQYKEKMVQLKNIRIVSTGSYAPSKVVTNAELEKQVSTTDQWIQNTLGIRERRIAAQDEWTSDLACRAGVNALEHAGLKPDDVDLIIVATATPDRKAPSTACIVQQKLGMRNMCPAFDVSAVCSGFLYAMTVGAQFIENGTCRTVLVIGADTFSKITDWSRRDCVFFGDGAGAIILQRREEPDGLFSSRLYANGQGMDNFTVYPQDAYFTMNGKAVYETGLEVLPRAIQTVLADNGLTLDDVSVVIPHQPSHRVLQGTAETLGIPYSKFKTNMGQYANTASATLSLLLDQVNKRGEIQKNDLVVFAAVGSGWTWGAALYRW